MFDDPVLSEKFEACPPALQEIIAEFREAPPRDRLAFMIDFSDALPDLPERLRGKRDSMEQVHECQTPVFLHAELADGRVHYYFDIPPESPTVRGYAGILAEGLNGASPDAILAVPDDVYRLLGLHEVISHLRLRGLHALMGYMKRQAARLSASR
ncbi:MAG: SufE family protein [Chloroflexi bacterium]|nr:SufE family protein [Chloroflexota bacterium]